MPTILAQEFHDIAPPVDYSLVPPWVIYTVVLLGLILIGAIIYWLWRRRGRKPAIIRSPREMALERLEAARDEIDRETPYRFSIRVSDILRRFVTEQYHLPLTRQTSVEFLSALARRSEFSEDDKSLLTDFLNRCDLIKFARYDATTADSELLLDEAFRFVKGGQLEPA
jgi:hypothetical protein